MFYKKHFDSDEDSKYSGGTVKMILEEIKQQKHVMTKAILYVDDDLDLLLLIKKFLEQYEDIHVHTCTSVRQALEILKTTPVDLVISDFLMPDITGLQFYQILKTEYTEIPFILFTGSKQHSLDQELIKMDDILVIEKAHVFDNHTKSFKHRIRNILNY